MLACFFACFFACLLACLLACFFACVLCLRALLACFACVLAFFSLFHSRLSLISQFPPLLVCACSLLFVLVSCVFVVALSTLISQPLPRFVALSSIVRQSTLPLWCAFVAVFVLSYLALSRLLPELVPRGENLPRRFWMWRSITSTRG